VTSASGDNEVLDRCGRVGIAGSLASSIRVEPCHSTPIFAPTADSDCHTIGKTLFHIVHVATALVSCGSHSLRI